MTMETKDYLFWLHRNFEEDSSSCFPLAELSSKFQQTFGDVSKMTIGRCVSFPMIKKTRQRSSGDWSKLIQVYKGIKLRETEQVDNFSFQDIGKYVPENYFMKKQSETEVIFSKHISKFNGNPIFLDLNFCQDGTVEFKIGETDIGESVGISKIDFTITSLKSLFSAIDTFKYCPGIVIDKLSCIGKENAYIHTNAENIVAYSNTCHKILSLKSLKSFETCPACRNLCKYKESSTDTQKTDTHPENAQDFPPSIMTVSRENAPYLSKSQLALIESQVTNSKTVTARSWDSSVLQLALSIWSRSPRVYRQILGSGQLVLPSEVTLSKMKTSVDQKPGVNEDMLQWMSMAAKHQKLTLAGYFGGLIFDEMAIQQDLVIQRKSSKSNLIGFTDTGVEGEHLFKKKDKKILASHVMQFIFLGITGFRFAVAHYPTDQATAPQIYTMFWDVVQALERWDFHVLYTCMDGSANNRMFIKLHFDNAPLNREMTVTNPFCSIHKVSFLSDPSHLFKKIRNNILKSGTEKWHTRLLLVNDNEVTWKLFIKAYEWDKRHGLSIHYKLSNTHLHPNQADKMRNHLAEEVLDEDMLHLMKRFQASLPNGEKIQGVISLLEQTSILIKFFRDRRPIFSPSDARLSSVQNCLKWFCEWEKSVSTFNFLSKETFEDINYLINGFHTLVNETTLVAKHHLTPLFVNSDIVENHFSQQRGLHHGSGSNPNYLQYCNATNSITLCQGIISKKANAYRRKSSTQTGALPFKQLRLEQNN